MLLADNYAFYDFYQRMMVDMSEGSDHGRYDRVCSSPSNKHTKPCVFNVAKAFVKTKQHIQDKLGLKQSDW